MSIATHDRIPEAALDWLRAGKGAALATVIETWGSAPRPRGSQLAISSDAEMAGSVSGGCVEGAVVAEALEALGDGVPRLLEYGVSDEEAFAVGLACGGTIRVMVEPLGVGDGPDTDLIARLAAARAERRPVVYAVRPETWERRLIEGPDDPLWEAARARLASDQSGFEDEWFLAAHNPPLRMAVVGAVHIAQALAPMARLAGYDVAIVDPREAFASDARFPDARLMSGWPDEALAEFGLDTRTAVVTLTHDPKLDDPAIMAALQRARSSISAASARNGPMPSASTGCARPGSRMPKSPGSTRRWARISARKHRPRSPSRSSRRSRSGCGVPRRGPDALRAGRDARRRGCDPRPFGQRG